MMLTSATLICSMLFCLYSRFCHLLRLISCTSLIRSCNFSLDFSILAVFHFDRLALHCTKCVNVLLINSLPTQNTLSGLSPYFDLHFHCNGKQSIQLYGTASNELSNFYYCSQVTARHCRFGYMLR